jgi:hypothetical protein
MDETTTSSDHDAVPIDEPVVLVGTYEDNTKIAVLHWPLRGQKEVIECAVSEPPRLITQVMWRSFAMADRMVLAEEGSVVADAVVLDDMT